MEGTWIESLQEKNIAWEFYVIEPGDDWTQPIKDFILHEKFPDDEKEARKICTTYAKYVMIDDQLYKTMGNWPLLNYVSPADGQYVALS